MKKQAGKKLQWFGLKVNNQLAEIIPWYQGEPEVGNFRYSAHSYEKPEVVKVKVIEQ